MNRSVDKPIHATASVASSKGFGRRSFVFDLLPRNSIGAEVGVHTGGFARGLLELVEPQKLHLIDPWKHESDETYRTALYGGRAQDGQTEMDRRYAEVCAQFEDAIGRGQVEIQRGFSADVLARFPACYFDWVYIDGNHLYEFVKTDLELAFKKTKAGGYIIGDDYDLRGWWEGGVKRAVDEFAAAAPHHALEIRESQFIFRKSG